MNTETRRKIRIIANQVSGMAHQLDTLLDELASVQATEHTWIESESKHQVRRSLADLQVVADIRDHQQVMQHLRSAITHLKASSSNAHGVVTQLIEASA